MLGIIIEICTGKKYAHYFYEKLMKPLVAKDDAYVTLDKMGTSRAAGGICISASDIMSICEMVRNYGKMTRVYRCFQRTGSKIYLTQSPIKNSILMDIVIYLSLIHI